MTVRQRGASRSDRHPSRLPERTTGDVNGACRGSILPQRVAWVSETRRAGRRGWNESGHRPYAPQCTWWNTGNGDARPRRALWSRNEPVSVLGAWRNARGQRELDELFTSLAGPFSDCTSYVFDLQAYDVVGDMAYTAGLEHTSASVNGQPRSYTLRATQVYRREGGEWKVAHRHGDTVTE